MTDLEKLKHLLKHWLEHNDAHINTYSEWANRAEAMNEKELSGILSQITEDSRKLNKLFGKAMEAIK